MDKFYEGEFEDYILMPSRINITKRQKLAIEAMCHVRSDLKLLIVGAAGNKAEEKDLTDFIRSRKLDKRVRYLNYIPLEEKLRLYANARAVLFIPIDEDLGYITLEAMAAGKPVVTCTDSGGPLEFILNEKSGFAAEPNAEAIAEKIDILMDSKLAREMGSMAKKHLGEMNITWDHVVRELTRP
jgi:glycosyltransferase involved in cell wall biosynthesis